MKKIVAILAMLTMTIAANAQFEEGKKYLAGSINSLGMSYNGANGFQFGLAAHAGYFLRDNWLLKGQLGYEHQNTNVNSLAVGAGVRYYIIQNGLFGGINLQGVFAEGRNDFVPGVEIGYAFFINDKVTIEPSVYYDQSFSSHKDFSTVGLKIGFGVYL